MQCRPGFTSRMSYEVLLPGTLIYLRAIQGLTQDTEQIHRDVEVLAPPDT